MKAKPQVKREAPMLQIGHARSTIDATGVLVRHILATPNGDAVKIAAIQAVTAALQINSSVSGCVFHCENESK